MSEGGAKMACFQPDLLCDLKPTEAEEILTKGGEGRGVWRTLQDFNGNQSDGCDMIFLKRFLDLTFESFGASRMVIIDPHRTIDEDERLVVGEHQSRWRSRRKARRSIVSGIAPAWRMASPRR